MSIVTPWLQSCAVLSLLPLLALAERLLPETSTPRVRWRRRRADLGFLGLAAVLLPGIGLAIGAAAATVAARGPLFGMLRRAPLPAMGVGFVLAELAAYVAHRGEHSVDRLWRMHAVHHSAANVDVLGGFRFHPLSVTFERAVPVVAVALLGVPIAALVPYLAAVTVVTLVAHANVESPIGWIARVVVTPGYHRSHHEHGRERANFALVLPVIDVLFGTADFSVGTRRFIGA